MSNYHSKQERSRVFFYSLSLKLEANKLLWKKINAAYV